MSGPECGPDVSQLEGDQHGPDACPGVDHEEHQPDNRLMEGDHPVQHCPTCCTRVGPEARLRRLQINNEECVSVCSNVKCLSNPSSSSLILRRKSSEIPNIRRRRRKHSAPSQEILSPPSFDRILLWQNKDALCWLDSSLFLVVFCRSLRKCLDASPSDEDSLKLLCQEFDNAQVTFQAENQALLQVENQRTRGNIGGRQDSTIPLSASRTGAGLVGTGSTVDRTCHSEPLELSGTGATMVSSFDESSELMKFLDEDTSFINTDSDQKTGSDQKNYAKTEESMDSISTPYRVGGNSCEGDPGVQGSSYKTEESLVLLEKVRERLWEQVQPKLRCERGEEDSPVFALPVILRKSRNLEAHFRTLYHWQFSCSHCGFVEITPCKSVMPSLKTLSKLFNVTTYLSHRPCPACSAPGQRNRLFIRSLPPCPMFHFIEGLPEVRSWSQLDFHHGGHEYRVAALIQYKQNPNHFIGWVKDTERNLWLQGDDLKGPVVHWSLDEPSFPAAECHVVMWERQGECTDCNSLQSVVRGILDAEQLDLIPPSLRDLDKETWPESMANGLSLPSLEGYIPKHSESDPAAVLSEQGSKDSLPHDKSDEIDTSVLRDYMEEQSGEGHIPLAPQETLLEGGLDIAERSDTVQERTDAVQERSDAVQETSDVVEDQSAAVSGTSDQLEEPNADDNPMRHRRRRRRSDIQDYKRKLTELSRVIAQTPNEVEGPLRKDLERRARLGRLATINSAEQADKAMDVDRILSSIPPQLTSIPTSGRRNSLESWKQCRGKPFYLRPMRAMDTRRSSGEPVSISSEKASVPKRAAAMTGLAAKFASFRDSLPTFSQYKETVESTRQVGNPPPLTRHQRAGSVSPICSPSGSSESSNLSDNSRLVSAFPEDFLDVTPMGSPNQFLPDLEKFFDGL